VIKRLDEAGRIAKSHGPGERGDKGLKNVQAY
jgi:hypothetical protein